MKITIPTFKGIVPLADPRVLAPEVATEAVNCRFERGNLEPYQEYMPVNHLIETNTQTIYLYNRGYWFSWDADVDVILSPTIDDQYDTVIWTGDNGYPRIGYNESVTGNATPPNASFKLGVPAPTNSPSTVVNGNELQDESGSENDETRFYVYTYVTKAGEEGAPSPVSDEITIINSATASVNLTVSAPSPNVNNITHYRVYRTGTTLETSDFFYVGENPIANLSFTDSSESTGSLTLTTIDYDEPPESMIGLTLLPNGIAAGFTGKTVCFSEPYLPYAYPVGYRQTTEDDIVSIAVVGNSLVVATEGNPYLFTGISPDSMSSIKLETKQACVSKRSMVDMGDYAIYASPDGLVAVSERQAEVITKNIIRRDQWQAKYEPDTIHAAQVEGKYIAFYGGTAGFIFDPETQTLTDLDFYATALYNDLKTDRLNMVVDGQIKVWDAWLNPLEMRWKKRFELNGYPLPTCCRLESSELENLHFKVWVDGALVLDIDPVEEVFWLPPLRGEYFEIEVSGTGVLRGIVMADNRRELTYG